MSSAFRARSYLSFVQQETGDDNLFPFREFGLIRSNISALFMSKPAAGSIYMIGVMVVFRSRNSYRKEDVTIAEEPTK